MQASTKISSLTQIASKKSSALLSQVSPFLISECCDMLQLQFLINYFYPTGKFRLESSSNGTFYECDRIVDRGALECSYALLEAYSPLGNEGTWIGESIATAENMKDGWTTLAGIMTVSEKQAAHTRLFVKMYGSDIDMNIHFDDVSLIPVDRSCDDLVLNGDFEFGDSRFWRPSDRRYIDVDILTSGASSSQYSMAIQKYTGHRMRQPLDTRCIVEGQQFAITAQFKYINATDLVSGVSCEPTIKSQSDVKACPTIVIRGTQCESNDLEYTFWNEIDQEENSWDSNGFNNFEKVFNIDANIAKCDVSS